VNEGRTIREGDIIVTRVVHHYALGRVNADHQTQTPIETQNLRADALCRACLLAGADHRVFLYDLAGPGARGVPVDRTKTSKPTG
jgi:hypothetical protein